MFSLFNKNPKEKLQKKYQEILELAMQAQRKGDIRLYSELSDKADVIAKQLDALKKVQ